MHAHSLTIMLILSLSSSFLQCPDDRGCDICPNGPIMNGSLVVTINVPGTGNSETATCVEWFGTGCALVQPENCPAYQDLLLECCILSENNDSESPTSASATDNFMNPGSGVKMSESPSSSPSGSEVASESPINAPGGGEIADEAPSALPSDSGSPTVSNAPSETPIAVS